MELKPRYLPSANLWGSRSDKTTKPRIETPASPRTWNALPIKNNIILLDNAQINEPKEKKSTQEIKRYFTEYLWLKSLVKILEGIAKTGPITIDNCTIKSVVDNSSLIAGKHGNWRFKLEANKAFKIRTSHALKMKEEKNERT